MNWLILIAMLLLPSLASAETLYSRPATDCPINGDGTAYACADTPSGAGAYSGNTNILWNASTTAGQVDPGDTLYVCGTHVGTSVVPTVSGTTNARITISGDCPGDPGILDGNQAISRLINLASAGPINYITVDSLTFQNTPNNTDYTLIAYDDDGTAVHDRFITISNNTLTNIGWIAIWLWGSEFTVTNNTIRTVGEDAIYIKGGKNSTVTGNTISRVSQNGVGGDCIQFDSAATVVAIGTGTVLVSDNVCDKSDSPNVKYGVLVGPVDGLTTVSHNRILCSVSTTSSSGCNPIYVNAGAAAATAKVVVHGNYVSKGWRGITVATATNTAFRHQVTSNVARDAGTFGIWLDANTNNVDVFNNTIWGNQQYGLYLGKPTTTHQVMNNIFTENAIGLYYINAPSLGHTYNNFYGQTTANIHPVNGPTTLHATENADDPRLLYDGSLFSTSPVKRLGKAWGACRDISGRVCWYPPDMGAYQTSGRDMAEIRDLREGDSLVLAESGGFIVKEIGQGFIRTE